MPRPIFSVILPTYNRAYVLWRAIQSVIDQTEKNWELIVIDDGSSDCTLRMLEEFRDSRIRSISIDNSGPSTARNAGISKAQGEYIAYLDSDNKWEPHFLSTFLDYIQKDPKNVLWHCGQHNKFWERTTDGKWHLIFQNPKPGGQYSLQDVLSLAGADTGAMVHRRSIMTGVTGWDDQCRWIEDWDFLLRVYIAFPGLVRWIPEILFEYRQVHGDGADGICGEAREKGTVERTGRLYLLKKWRNQLTPEGIEKLSRPLEQLRPLRAKRSSS